MALCLRDIAQQALFPGNWLICGLAVPAQLLTGCCGCREWHIISHPLATNPFPASILNCKASIRVVPVLIPGNQSFVDYKVELLTELHAVDVMRKLIEGIMRVGLLSESRPSQVTDIDLQWRFSAAFLECHEVETGNWLTAVLRIWLTMPMSLDG